MKQGSITLAEVARMQHLTIAAARPLAEREHWPPTFKQSAIFVLPPHADPSSSAARKSG